MQQSRRFVDSFGFHWQVLEIDAAGASPDESSESAVSSGWLYFLCRGVTRVLRGYPMEWGGLGWDELEDLCARATPLGGDSLVHPSAPSPRLGQLRASREGAYR